MALVITKAFRTSSTEAILVLAGLLPADLRAKELAASHSLKSDWPETTFAKSHVTHAKRIVLDAGLPGSKFNQCGIIQKPSGRLPVYATAYEAEAVAICVALNYLKTLSSY